MNRIQKLGAIGFFLMAAPLQGYAQVAPGEVSSSMLNESMDAVIGTHQNIQWNTVRLSEDLKKSIKEELKIKNKLPDSLHVGIIKHEGSTYYVIPDIAPSKSEMFSYVLYLDADKEIVDVDVMEYRESYGYEIDYSFFRKQFHGKENPKEIRFNRTIQNISGATISARNITYAVHDLMLIVNGVELD